MDPVPEKAVSSVSSPRSKHYQSTNELASSVERKRLREERKKALQEEKERIEVEYRKEKEKRAKRNSEIYEIIKTIENLPCITSSSSPLKAKSKENNASIPTRPLLTNFDSSTDGMKYQPSLYAPPSFQQRSREDRRLSRRRELGLC